MASKPTNASGTNKLAPLAPGTATKKKGVLWNDPEFEGNYPTLTLYMVQDSFDNGSLRRTSTLTVYFDNGCLTVVLNDRENNRSCFVASESVFSAFLELERLLCNDEADWKIRASYNNTNGKTPF